MRLCMNEEVTCALSKRKWFAYLIGLGPFFFTSTIKCFFLLQCFSLRVCRSCPPSVLPPFAPVHLCPTGTLEMEHAEVSHIMLLLLWALTWGAALPAPCWLTSKPSATTSAPATQLAACGWPLLLWIWPHNEDSENCFWSCHDLTFKRLSLFH